MPLFSRLATLLTGGSTSRRVLMTADTRFAVDGNTRVTAEHEDGRTVMHLGAGRVWAINALGSEIWQRLAGGCTTREIVAELSAQYPVPVERIEQDVTAFVRRIVDLKLVRPVEQ